MFKLVFSGEQLDPILHLFLHQWFLSILLFLSGFAPSHCWPRDRREEIWGETFHPRWPRQGTAIRRGGGEKKEKEKKIQGLWNLRESHMLHLCGGRGLLSAAHELRLECQQKSFTTIRGAAEVAENAAGLSQGLLGLSQGLPGQARWSGWSWLPSPPLQQEIKHRG